MAVTAEPRTTEMVRTRRASFDGWILVSVLALTCIGLIMVYSASISDAYLYYKSPTYFLKREIIWIALGLIALVFGARLHYDIWRRFSKLLAGGAVLLLVAVLVPHLGRSSHGAQRWFQVGSFLSFQPSEFAKLALAIYMAHWLSQKTDKIGDFRNCSMPFGIMLGVICLLVLKQPDMGTAVVIGVAMIAVYFVAGARLDHLALGAGVSFLLALAALRLEAYRGARLAAWLNPWKYSHGAGYHTIQALLALGLGGLTGVGLGNSQQKYYLPAPYTDSIFAVTAEELGFLGALAIVALFVVLGYRGFKIALEAPDDFGKLLAVGITATIIVQAFVNVAVITASLPFTGVPLPFISFGGSSLVISMLGVGILLSISRHTRRATPHVYQDQQGGSDEDANSGDRRQDRRPRFPRTSRHRVPSTAHVQDQTLHHTAGRSNSAPGQYG